MLLVIYSTLIEPNLLITKRFDGYQIDNKIDGNQENGDLKIIHITDTQIGKFYGIDKLKLVVEDINRLDADIVVFTGDLIDSSNKTPNSQEIIQELKKINANIGKYSIYGNHDYIGELPKYYEEIMKQSGFEMLVNQNERIHIKEDKYINIIGLDEKLHGKPNTDLKEYDLSKEDFNLLLLHEPDIIDEIDAKSIDLALAGHSHGGQIRIPIKDGAIITPPYARKYTKGFYEINENRLYVSSGLGSTKLPFRLFNIPEIVLFDIHI